MSLPNGYVNRIIRVNEILGYFDFELNCCVDSNISIGNVTRKDVKKPAF